MVASKSQPCCQGNYLYLVLLFPSTISAHANYSMVEVIDIGFLIHFLLLCLRIVTTARLRLGKDDGYGLKSQH